MFPLRYHTLVRRIQATGTVSLRQHELERTGSRLYHTGVQINEAFAIVLTMARLHAFFSFVWPHVLETHPRMMLFTAYVPMANTHMAKYLAPVFSVAAASTKPKTATALAAVICQVRSLNLPDW